MEAQVGHAAAGEIDPAVAAARAVVGLYGDTSVSWSIMLDCELSRPLAPEDVQRRAASLAAENAHLGRRPTLVVFDDSDASSVMQRFADQPYGDRDSLTRVAVSHNGLRLIFAAHHGAVDGLGLVAAVGHLVGAQLSSSARGIPHGLARSGFVRASIQRLVEAALRPPQRFAPSPRNPARALSGQDWLLWRDVEVDHISSSDVIAATRRVLSKWNAGTGLVHRPVVVALGVSHRRAGEPLRPDRVTGYTRLLASDVWTSAAAQTLLTSTPPEPDFPATRGLGIGPLVTRALSSRLGSTVLVSNIGRISGSEDLDAVRMWASAAGPSGVAVGVATVGSRTGLSIRARRRDFDAQDAQRLLDDVAQELEHPSQYGS